MNEDVARMTQREAETLLAVATLYVEAFTDDDRFSWAERLQLQKVEDILAKYGRRY